MFEEIIMGLLIVIFILTTFADWKNKEMLVIRATELVTDRWLVSKEQFRAISPIVGDFLLRKSSFQKIRKAINEKMFAHIKKRDR